MNQDNMQQIQKRLNQYWYVDGISEISFGILCLILGIYFYVIAHQDESSLLFQLLTASLVLILVVYAFWINRLVAFFKNRITYPRTGYVRYRRGRSGWRLLVGGVAGLMCSALAIMISRLPAGIDWMPLITGIMVSLVTLFIAYRIGLWRYLFIACVAFILGLYLSLKTLGNYTGLYSFYLILGFLLCAIGVIILGRYVITNRSSIEELNEE